MQSYFKIEKVLVAAHRVEYEYSYSDDLKKYFKQDCKFFAEYSEDISGVPESIAVIPLVVNVLPLIWLEDAVLQLGALDRTFYDNLELIKDGYRRMYPACRFGGTVAAEQLPPHSFPAGGKRACFFSGGVDAYATLSNHFSESPDLVTVWGADVKLEEKQGWETVKNAVQQVGELYRLTNVFIKSSFREFLAYDSLNKTYHKQLRDDWWHGVQHGIGLIGLAAPYAATKHVEILYIASSFTNSDGAVTCASYPTIDNHVRFSSCQTVHDGFEDSRQDKIRKIVNFQTDSKAPVHVRVCWLSQDGGNCCRCEKCYRTIMGFAAEGEDPQKYGFSLQADTWAAIRRYMTREYEYPAYGKLLWKQIQERAVENRAALRRDGCAKQIGWIYRMDFSKPEKNLARRAWRVRNKCLRIISFR